MGRAETEAIMHDLIRMAATQEQWHRDHLDQLCKYALNAGIDPQEVASAAHLGVRQAA